MSSKLLKLFAVAGCSFLVLVATGARPAPPAAAGTIYVGTYAKNYLVLDEATMTVRDTIKLTVGIPYRTIPSRDRKHFYVLNPRQDSLEIIDVPNKKSLGVYTLNKDSVKVQIWSMNVEPKERYAVLLVKTYTKHKDRYEISRPMLLKYDLATKAVTDTIAWPAGEERDFANLMFSPDGDLIYFFTNGDVLIYSAQTLKQVERWDMAQSFSEEGMGRINAGFNESVYEDVGFYTSLFRVSDPVNHRQLMGVARIDLAKRSVDFYTLGPTAGIGFTLAPGKHRAYGIRQDIGQNYEFWTFDLDNRRVAGKAPFRGRPRMGLTVGTGGDLYIHTAGQTIDVYDPNTFQRTKTVELNADMTGLILVPSRAPGLGN